LEVFFVGVGMGLGPPQALKKALSLATAFMEASPLPFVLSAGDRSLTKTRYCCFETICSAQHRSVGTFALQRLPIMEESPHAAARRRKDCCPKQRDIAEI
jgi:hypothetical protein